MPLPGVGRQQPGAGGEVAVRAGKRGRRLGAEAGAQVELRQVHALADIGEQIGPVIEMVDDVEQPLALAAGSQQPSDREVRPGLLRGGDQGVGRLLHPVVQEAEAPSSSVSRSGPTRSRTQVLRDDQPLLDRAPQAPRRRSPSR